MAGGGWIQGDRTEEKAKGASRKASGSLTRFDTGLVGESLSGRIAMESQPDESSPAPNTANGCLLPIVNAVAFVVTLAFNGIGSSGALSGYAIGTVSSLHPTYITPDGYAFAIWGPIYILLGCYTVWQLTPFGR